MAMAYTTTWPPFQTLVLSAGLLAFGKSIFAACLTMAIIAALSVPVIYLVTWKLAGRREAILAGVLFSIYPSFIQYSLGTRSETTYIFLLLVSIYLILRLAEHMDNRYPTTRTAIFLGVTLGLAALTRSVGVILIPVVALWLSWHAHKIRRGIGPVVIFGIVAILTLAPWVTIASMIEGRFIPLSVSGDKTLGLSERCYGAACNEPAAEQLPRHEHPLPVDSSKMSSEDWSRYLQQPGLTLAPEISWSPVDWIPWSFPAETAWKDPFNFVTYGLQHWWIIWGPDAQAARQMLVAGYPPMNPAVVCGVILASIIMQLALLAFVILGILSAGMALRHNGLLIMLVLGSMAVHFVLAIGPKYSVPMQAILLPIAAQGMAHAGSLLKLRFGLQRPIVAMLLIALTWTTVITSGQPWFGHAVQSPSSHYAQLARQLEPYVVGNLPVSDRFLFRLSGESGPAVTRITIAEGEYRFQPDNSRLIAWSLQNSQVISVVTAAGAASSPVQLHVQTEGPEGSVHTVTTDHRAWQKWRALGSTGIEYMWIGSAVFPIDGLHILELSNDKPSLGQASMKDTVN